MGMSADVIAIGPFSEDIADVLGYPAEDYARTRPGVRVVTCLFAEGMSGTTTSRMLAERLGIDDPWDFNQHEFDPAGVDLDGLRAFLGAMEYAEDYLPDIDRFRRLRDKGFAFFLRPNY